MLVTQLMVTLPYAPILEQLLSIQHQVNHLKAIAPQVILMSEKLLQKLMPNLTPILVNLLLPILLLHKFIVKQQLETWI